MQEVDKFIDKDVVETAKCFSSNDGRLDQLPNEILELIGDHLDRSSISQLRTLCNRKVRDGFSQVFKRQNFHHRKCLTTDRSIAHLYSISHSWFANDIRSLEICLYLECNLEAASTPQRLSQTCVSAYMDIWDLERTLVTLFGRAQNLRGITIRAPTKDNLFLPPLIPHQHVTDMTTVQKHFHTILEAIQGTIHSRLQRFRLLGFSKSQWEALMAPAPLTQDFLVHGHGMPNLTNLNLDFEMQTHSSNQTLVLIVAALKRCPKMQSLKLCAGPDTDVHFQRRSENWAPLLELLGANPPFSLRTLEIDGLVSSTTAPTLAHIIDAHASSMRRLVLYHLNFHFPNTLREFFTALSKTGINYFCTKSFQLHDKYCVRNSTLVCRERYDEVLEFDGEDHGKDESYQDWIEVDWKVNREDTELVYDCRELRVHERPMKEIFVNVVELVDSGAIKDW